MDADDSRIIARFQRLTTELLAEKRLGQVHPELLDELYRISLELEQRGLKKSAEYRNALLRADQHAWRLVECAKLSGSDSASSSASPPQDEDSSASAAEKPSRPPSSANED
jgi:inactivated superfamily I helicase